MPLTPATLLPRMLAGEPWVCTRGLGDILPSIAGGRGAGGVQRGEAMRWASLSETRIASGWVRL